MLIALLVVAGLVTVAAAQQPRYGGTLRAAWEQDVTGFDPHWSAGLQNIYMAGNLFNNLVTIDDHFNYVPELAESWEVQDDGKVYVFRLHKGVKFHDGTDFDAAAVAWNFDRIMDPEERALGRSLFQIVAAVEPLDRPIFLKKLTSPNPADRDWDQMVNFTGSSFDAYTRSFVMDSRSGINLVNHQDPKLDALWDQLKQAATAEEFSRLGQEVQRYIARNMIHISATTLPFIQAARDSVKGYVYERGFKIRFEQTWLDKPQG
jgi:ABC-type transport system substrate-binding protein